MKKNTLFICAVFAFSTLFAQHSKKMDQESGYVTCSDFQITKPLRELFPNVPADEKADKKRKKHEQEDREYRVPQKFVKTAEKDGPAYGNDPATLQTEMGSLPGKAPIQNWAGQTTNQLSPLDPTGAAGPNHYIQMINATTFKIWNKTGGLLLSGILGNLWTPHLTYNDGDPIVLYDKAADRWFLAQFGDNFGNSGNYVHIAVSTSPDPTGSWYTYTFTMPEFVDYLKFSVWQDGYYMNGNLNPSQKVYVYERAAMLAGNSAARMTYHTFTPPYYNGNWFLVPLPGDTGDGSLAPAGTPCPIFTYSDNGWGGSYTDAVNVFNATTSWSGTPSVTITSAGSIPATAFDASYNTSWNDVSQPGVSQKLDGIGGCLMFRAQYKSFAGYNSVVLCWGVKVSTSTGQRGIKWCELRQTGGTWAMYQQGIYAPTTDNFWMGSIAMNNNGDIGLCYMKSNATSIYPSLCYTGRRSCDALGTMTIAETVAKAGTGSQNGDNRDGDYSETWLDPDGVTFWHTGMYMGSGGSQQTQIYSFQITPCVSTPPVANFSAAATTVCVGQAVALTDLSTNTPTGWAWTMTGGTPASSTIQNPTVTYSAPGTYTVSLVASNSAGSNSHTVTINVNPTPATPSVTSNSPLCAGSAINFTTPAVTGATYAWTGPSSFSSSAQNATQPAATTAMAGTYSLTVTVGGCTSVAGTAAVAVTAAPTTANAGPAQTTCLSTATMAANTATVGTGMWTLVSGTGTITNPASPTSTVTGLALGANVFQWTITNAPCPASSSQVTITVNSGSVSTPVITLVGGTLLSSSIALGNQWYWNGTLISGATAQNFTPTVNGTYTDIVTINGCSSAVSNSIVFTNVGISEAQSANSIDIYPNPNEGIFTVSFNVNEKVSYKLEIVNALGQLVFKQNIKDFSGTYSQKVDITGYGKGVYLLLLTDENNKAVKKVLVY